MCALTEPESSNTSQPVASEWENWFQSVLPLLCPSKGRNSHTDAARGSSSCPGLLMEPLKVKGGIIKEGVLYLHLPSLRTQRVFMLFR